jgi:hypothetical protein
VFIRAIIKAATSHTHPPLAEIKAQAFIKTEANQILKAFTPKTNKATCHNITKMPHNATKI